VLSNTFLCIVNYWEVPFGVHITVGHIHIVESFVVSLASIVM